VFIVCFFIFLLNLQWKHKRLETRPTKTRPGLSKNDLRTLMLPIGRWRSINVCVSHRKANRERGTLIGKRYKYTAVLLLKIYVCVCVCVCQMVTGAVCVPSQTQIVACQSLFIAQRYYQGRRLESDRATGCNHNGDIGSP